MQTRTRARPGMTEGTSGDMWRSPALYIFEQGGCNLSGMSEEPLSEGAAALGEQLSGYYGTC